MYCARHPKVEAVAECLRCQQLHCKGCVRQLGNEHGNEHVTIGACAHCDGVVRALDLRVPRSLRAQAQDLLARLATGRALLIIGVIGLLGALSDLPLPVASLPLLFAYLAAVASTYYNVVDHVAGGKAGFPAPVAPDAWSPMTPVLRGLVLLIVVLTPFAIWHTVNPTYDSIPQLFESRPGFGLALVVVAIFWGTAAVLATLDNVHGLAAFWPPALGSVIVRAPWLYLGLVLQVGLTSLLAWTLRSLLLRATGGMPFISGFVVAATTAVVLFAQAALLGGVVQRNHVRLGLR
jgi:hypothetical protein